MECTVAQNGRKRQTFQYTASYFPLLTFLRCHIARPSACGCLWSRLINEPKTEILRLFICSHSSNCGIGDDHWLSRCSEQFQVCFFPFMELTQHYSNSLRWERGKYCFVDSGLQFESKTLTVKCCGEPYRLLKSVCLFNRTEPACFEFVSICFLKRTWAFQAWIDYSPSWQRVHIARAAPALTTLLTSWLRSPSHEGRPCCITVL